MLSRYSLFDRRVGICFNLYFNTKTKYVLSCNALLHRKHKLKEFKSQLSPYLQDEEDGIDPQVQHRPPSQLLLEQPRDGDDVAEAGVNVGHPADAGPGGDLLRQFHVGREEAGPVFLVGN